MLTKQLVYDLFLSSLQVRIAALKDQLADLSRSTANETKSTAGDKYETSRAMLQIEQDNVRTQLQQVLEQKASIDMVQPDQISPVIERGSLIQTNRGWFFIAAALGRQVIGGVSVTAISMQSPLGLKLVGLKPGDELQVNQTRYTIVQVL